MITITLEDLRDSNLEAAREGLQEVEQSKDFLEPQQVNLMICGAGEDADRNMWSSEKNSKQIVKNIAQLVQEIRGIKTKTPVITFDFYLVHVQLGLLGEMLRNLRKESLQEIKCVYNGINYSAKDLHQVVRAEAMRELNQDPINYHPLDTVVLGDFLNSSPHTFLTLTDYLTHNLKNYRRELTDMKMDDLEKFCARHTIDREAVMNLRKKETNTRSKKRIAQARKDSYTELLELQTTYENLKRWSNEAVKELPHTDRGNLLRQEFMVITEQQIFPQIDQSSSSSSSLKTGGPIRHKKTKDRHNPVELGFFQKHPLSDQSTNLLGVSMSNSVVPMDQLPDGSESALSDPELSQLTKDIENASSNSFLDFLDKADEPQGNGFGCG